MGEYEYVEKLAAISVAALANTEASRKANRIGPEHPAYSSAYRDVCRAVDSEMEHRVQAERFASVSAPPPTSADCVICAPPAKE